MISTLSFLRAMLWPVVPMVFVALMGNAPAAGKSLPDICKRWPQNRLVIDSGLESKRFKLEAIGEPQLMPRSPEVEARAIFHRTFSLSLDIAEPVALFNEGGRTIVIARDKEKNLPLWIPVFYVGRTGQKPEDLKSDAERAAFAPSESLSGGGNFAGITFYLKSGGWSFSEVRPFFVCGKPGLLLCESSCPGNSVALAESLVNSVVQGVGRSAASKPRAATPPAAPAPAPAPSAPVAAAQPAPVCVPATTPLAQAPAPAASPLPPAASPPSPPKPAAAPTPPLAQAPAPAASPPPPAVSPPSPPTPEPAPTPRQAPVPPSAPPSASPPPAPATAGRLVLAFERESGSPIDAADVLAAEGSVRIEGVPLTATAGGLAADLPADAVAKAATLEALQHAFRHYRVLSVRNEETRTVLKAEPLFVPAAGLTITIADASGQPAKGCDPVLNVAQSRRLGQGWAKVPASGLTFEQSGAGYGPRMPENVARNALLIDISETGTAALLSNTAPHCELEGQPYVTAEELGGGVISRRLRERVRESQRTLIALVSTDSEFSDKLGAPAAQGFWSSAIELVASVSEGPWQSKLLARAQFPGPSEDTRILDNARAGRLAAGKLRESVLKELMEGSRQKPGALAITGTRPIERFQLDLALDPIRADAELPAAGAPQEALLLITGGIDPSGSYSCRNPVRPNTPAAQWVTQAQKAFMLEIWSDAEAEALQKSTRAKPAEGAPDGIYVCNIPGAGKAKIALYGAVPAALTDSARPGSFFYLTARAIEALKP